ncbi:MAG: GNAT family N-acetyltransferase [Clostridia bacterium]|nr:GNAT family N-acetyltransferase [Clostridia bacterium]
MLTHKGTQTITTERLTLRRFTVDDAQEMYDNWANDPRVTKFLSWEPHASPEATAALLKDWVAAYENANCYNWVMEYKKHCIGTISVVRISDRNESAELGYDLGFDYWNMGFMTETVKAVIAFLFDEVGCHRIVIRHAVKNPASGKVAQKCGLTHEGTQHEAFKDRDGEFLDLAEYAILRDEWNR